MAGNPLYTVLDHLRRLHRVADAAQRSDRELLRAFATDNDQDAFALVVTRHAPLVWGVCRRILGHHHDAEDAFQATFLILARRAGSIRWRSSVGGWLHTVAQRLAVRARQQTQQRRIQERQVSQASSGDTSLRELAAVVDEELRHLPAKYREPLLLHYLEGITAETAARQLGLSRAAFYNRLTRGREMLRERLSRQGLSLATPLLASALTGEAESASGSLIQATIGVVRGNAPERVAALAAEALGVTAVTKLKISLALGLLLGMSTGGVAILTLREPMSPLPQAARPPEPSKAEEKSAVRVDRYGDPLPPGVSARLGTLRFRAPGEIGALAFAPDSKTLLVSSHGGMFLFDALSGKRLRRIPSASPSWRPEELLMFSPDGKRLIARGDKITDSSVVRVVRVWELASGHQTQEYDIGQFVLWVGWSSEAQPLALHIEDNGTLYLHELSAGRSRRFACAKPYKYPSGFISVDPPFACSPQGHALAVADEEGAIHIWDTTTGRERRTLQPKGNYVSSLTFSPDGRRLMVRTAKDLQMWDAIEGKVVYTVDTTNVIYGPGVFSPDGKTLAIIKSWDSIRFWDAATGKERGHTQEKDDFSASFALSTDGNWLATARRHGGGAFHVWEVATGTKQTEPVGHHGQPYGTAFAPDGQRVATGGTMDGTFRLWDYQTGEQLLCIEQRGMTRGCAFSEDGKSLWASWSYGGLALYDATTGQQRHIIKLEDPDRPDTYQSIMSMHLSGDGKRLVAFSYYYAQNQAGPRYNDTLITGWNTFTRKQLFRRRRPGMDSWVALSPDARVLAVPHPEERRERGPGQGPMRLEDVGTGELLLTFPTQEGQTWPLAFSPDGRLLASNNSNNKRATKDGQSSAIMQLWEVATAAEVLSLPGADSNNRVAFSPDGRMLALTAPAQQILIYDLTHHREWRRLQGFDAEVTWLAFSLDGHRLISGFSDSTLLVWDVGAPPAVIGEKLGAESAAKAWSDLAGPGAPRAFRARGKLASAPEEAIPLLRKHLRPAQASDPQHLRRLLADLESAQFAVREKAQEKLVQLGDLAESALRQTLESNPSLEMRQRVQAILERLRAPVTQPELLQALRAVAVLEDIDTSQARQILKELANGAPQSRITREARASLERMERRSTIKRREK